MTTERPTPRTRPYGAAPAAPAGPATPAGPVTVELEEGRCWELLRRQDLGRLAVVTDEGPDIFPVTYVVDHGTVVFRTAAGTKLAAAHHRRVAFEADGRDDPPGTAWSVVLHGRAERLLDRDENLEALALPLVPWHGGSKPWFVRVVPDRTTGRRVGGGA